MSQLKNVKQESLAQALFMGGKTQLQAYKEAGYKGNSTAAATKACQQPDVQVRLAELVRDRHAAQRMANERALEQESITKAYVVTRFKFLADRGIRGTVPVYDAKGEQTGWRPTGSDTSGAIRSLEVLARMGGHLVDKVEIGQPGDFARLTNEELEAQLVLVGESIGLDPAQVQKAIKGDAE